MRGETWDERSPSANVPAPTALAASWDVARVERVARLLAFECRRKGVDVLLAPTVNLHRTPYGGRHFECFSEDPYLTGAIGAAFVRGLQEEGVAATVKHFVANDSETERFTLDAVVDERTLRELYALPFELILAAEPWAVMAAYNRVNGTTMTDSPLIQSLLREEWGYDGVVMSDWGATRSARRRRWISRCRGRTARSTRRTSSVRVGAPASGWPSASSVDGEADARGRTRRSPRSCAPRRRTGSCSPATTGRCCR